jgi:Protein of unknown function (DUF1571)
MAVASVPSRQIALGKRFRERYSAALSRIHPIPFRQGDAMTVHHLIRRAWLAALLGSAAIATAQDPLPLPPLPGATPVVPPKADLPPLTPATGTTPVVPPAAPATLPPLVSEAPKAPAPAVPPPMTQPPMAPMPSAAPALPPMTLPGEVKPTGAVVKAPPTSPMAPAIPPTFEAKSEIKTVSASAASVKVGKPAIDGLAAYSMMLAEAKIAYGKISDYSGHVIHQDRIRGKLTADQTAEIRVKAKPASIALKYVAPNALMGQELAYVAGRNGGKLRFKPAGSFGPGGFSTVELSDTRATTHTRHAATEVGIGPTIELLEKNLGIEQRLRNAVQVTVSDYVYANRPVTRFEVFTDRAHALRFAYRTVVYVDKETKLPIRMEAYDQPTIGGSPTGELMECYSYVNLKFNQGLGDAVFEK